MGTGWLGFALVQRFVQDNFKLNVSARSTKESLNIPKVQAYIVDIDNLSDNVHDFLSSDILILNIPSKNTNSFKNLIKHINISSISKVLFVSSTSVCHNNSTSNPLLEIEYLFKNSKEFKTTILRFGGLIGPGRNPGDFFKNGKEVKSANARVNLIHRDDCINIMEQIILQDAWGEILNACADAHPTKREFYTQVCALAGNAIPKFLDSDSTLPEVISNEKLKKVLNYKFTHSEIHSPDTNISL